MSWGACRHEPCYTLKVVSLMTEEKLLKKHTKPVRGSFARAETDSARKAS